MSAATSETLRRAEDITRPADPKPSRLESAAFWLLITTLAWAPFPLGSNRPWSWSLLALLIATCWCLWLFSGGVARVTAQMSRRTIVPILFALAVLTWAVVQILPGLSSSSSIAFWQLASQTLGYEIAPTISLDPWRTATEAMKLATYAMTMWLALVLCRRPARARLMLSLLIVIGGGYAIYTLALGIRGTTQVQIFYDMIIFGDDNAGPFVNRNSYATFAGLVLVCALARLVDVATAGIVVSQGVRRLALTLAQFLVGPGMAAILVVFLSLSTLIATGSRAGFVSALVAVLVLLLFSAVVAAKRVTPLTAILVVAALFTVGAAVFVARGEMLAEGLDRLAQTGGALELRGVLWEAAWRMISDAPLTGFGLGTYEYAYPLYADAYFSVTMDKAHNDYLELAAGLGLPAAILWWGAILWLAGLCVQAVFVRRHDRVYPLIAIGATALVGFHSIFDFSLQIPAVALFYAAILGLGVAQSFSARAA